MYCKGALIINQSQQRGIETLLTRFIAGQLYSYAVSKNVLCSYLVDCFRLEKPTYTESLALSSSVTSANNYYNRALKYHPKERIRQVDIHCNSYNGKNGGLLLLWTSQAGHSLASNIISEFRKVYPSHIEGQRQETGLYTLNYSRAVNVIIECGYYDNFKDFSWFYEHTAAVVKAIYDGVLKSVTV